MRPFADFYKDKGDLFFHTERHRPPIRRYETGFPLDVIVKPLASQTEWLLSDLLGRPMGVIRLAGGTFAVEPYGNACETMEKMRYGPFGSLDDALAAIERHTRGVCRREPVQTARPGRDEVTDTSTDISEKASTDPT